MAPMFIAPRRSRTVEQAASMSDHEAVFALVGMRDAAEARFVACHQVGDKDGKLTAAQQVIALTKAIGHLRR